jgi:large subunit ribosomal protein L18
VAQRPRLSVFRSHKHIYVQAIDDATGRTLAAASTREKELGVSYGGNKTAAQAVGRAIADRLLAAGVKHVAFDRGSFQYHGRVRALAEAAREGGLQF